MSLLLSLNAQSIMAQDIEQAKGLWRESDGNTEEFDKFVKENLVKSADEKLLLFNKLSAAYEVFFGMGNMMDVRLKMPVTLAGEKLLPIDYILGSYNPMAHLSDDLFDNKVAFITSLNFPNYTLAQKDSLGKDWTKQQWAYARMGDIFKNRIPADVKQKQAQVYGNAENYIASYNIMMGHILNEKGEKLFPKDMMLLSHWNLRDEIKSNYADIPNALEKQKMIYKIMERIIDQSIPLEVINNPEYDWKPYSNTLYKDGKEVKFMPEGNARYAHLLENFHLEQELDMYNPQLPSGIIRNFEGTMEVSAKEIEELFINLISSKEIKEVSKIIKKKVGRKLQPYDIWFDGFKGRTSISEDSLSSVTRQKYPNAQAFKDDMPRMLNVLGFSEEDAKFLSDRIVVEAARGSGHAAGAMSRWEPARLRTRISDKGMDYKGYNIAVHEFGHNVEQTFSMYNVEHYIMNGVPNTAFTEALAFIFQKRDLKLLGYNQEIDDNTTLDIFWGAYEIMGVSLVDMYTWKWMYENPNCSADELKDATIRIAKEVWNKYYEPILGTKDSPILAVYSHMINVPMYLPNYPFGHIIEFQLENYFAGKMKEEGKNFADEIKRIYSIGRLTPQVWMIEAIGEKISTDPLIQAVKKILQK